MFVSYWEYVEVFSNLEESLTKKRTLCVEVYLFWLFIGKMLGYVAPWKTPSPTNIHISCLMFIYTCVSYKCVEAFTMHLVSALQETLTQRITHLFGMLLGIYM